MNNKQQKVLACIDDSKLSEAVSDYAAWIAQRVEVPLKLLNMINHHHETAVSSDLSGSLGIDGRDHLLEEIAEQEQQEGKVRIKQGKALLQVAKERVIKDGVAEPETCLQHGTLIDALVEFEDEIRVMVMGARGKGREGQPHQIGSKLESVIRSLHRPILVAYEGFKAPEQIMIAYDGSEGADKAIDIVANSPLYKGLKCHLVYVGSNNGRLDKAADKLRAAGGLEILPVYLDGKADEKLCAYQLENQIDMTIMGAFSHTRIHDLILGSFTAKMLLNTNTPLLLLR